MSICGSLDHTQTQFGTRSWHAPGHMLYERKVRPHGWPLHSCEVFPLMVVSYNTRTMGTSFTVLKEKTWTAWHNGATTDASLVSQLHCPVSLPLKICSGGVAVIMKPPYTLTQTPSNLSSCPNWRSYAVSLDATGYPQSRLTLKHSLSASYFWKLIFLLHMDHDISLLLILESTCHKWAL